MAYTIKKKPVFKNTLEAALTYALVGVGILVTFTFGAWWFQVDNIPQNFEGVWHAFDFILFGALTLVVWYQILMEVLAWDLALAMRAPVPTDAPKDIRVALATAFVPGKEPIQLLEKTLTAMLAVRYPHDTWVLDEGDDADVKALCRTLGVRHFTRKGIPEFNTESGRYMKKTKGGNFNAWFATHGAEYDVVAQHDVDFTPFPEYLDKTLGYFKDPSVAFVGTPQVYGNGNESLVARGAAEQAYGFYGYGQQGLFGHDMQFLIGSNHVIRVSAHTDIGGYAGHISEDHLTGMRVYGRGWKSVYVPETLLVGEGPVTWSAYFGQQMRWAYGLMDILFRHSPRHTRALSVRHLIRYVALQHYYFFGIAQLAALALISIYFLFGIHSASMPLAEALIFFPLLILVHLATFFWFQRFSINPKEETGLHIYAKILTIAVWPIYAIAFLGAIIGTKLSYTITPKGETRARWEPHVFTPHIILGTVGVFCLLVAIIAGRAEPLFVVLTLAHIAFMYGVVALAFIESYASGRTYVSVFTSAIRAEIRAFSLSGSRLAFVQTATTSAVLVFLMSVTLATTLIPYQSSIENTPVRTAPVVSTVEDSGLIAHEVRDGEYLRLIAQNYLGDESRWTDLEFAGNPDVIHPGDIVRVRQTN